MRLGEDQDTKSTEEARGSDSDTPHGDGSTRPTKTHRSDGRKYVEKNSLSEAELLEERDRVRATLRSKKATSTVTKEEAKAGRRASNRLSAFLARKRNKAAIDELKATIASLSKINAEQCGEIGQLQNDLAQARAENAKLQVQLQSRMQQVPQGQQQGSLQPNVARQHPIVGSQQPSTAPREAATAPSNPLVAAILRKLGHPNHHPYQQNHDFSSIQNIKQLIQSKCSGVQGKMNVGSEQAPEAQQQRLSQLFQSQIPQGLADALVQAQALQQQEQHRHQTQQSVVTASASSSCSSTSSGTSANQRPTPPPATSTAIMPSPDHFMENLRVLLLHQMGKSPKDA
uniref:BZIP domain-containing protein n=1 Tax=Entomoneis paludosa TaxID=265537 RepID=A0A7S2YB06_9STRA|mmetsp:Transcript_25608/g.53329  ORF Transcript_25608/g.53329 Transcript_25608/m.53329 type:complete len:343 (+) Transcript_25608:165-1193(+)